MKTTGRSPAGMWRVRPYCASSSAGMRIPSARISLSMAPVDPVPANSTTQSSPAPKASAMISRASSRKRVV